MIQKIHTAITHGIDSKIFTIEVHHEPSATFSFSVIGLPQYLSLQIRKRIEIALKQNGIELPKDIKIVVNLGLFYGDKTDVVVLDLPITIGILMNLGAITIDKDFLDKAVFIGELGLSGDLRPIKGALSIAIATQEAGKSYLVLPYGNCAEAQAIDKINLYGYHSLSPILNGSIAGSLPYKKTTISGASSSYDIDFADVKGQLVAKRALQIAAAGHHNIIFMGPPGSGKTMLAQRLPTIMPELTYEEIIETSRIYSSMGGLTELISKRPFRSPHHSATLTSLIGGGVNHHPGDISLAHNGILFMDEFTEFKPSTLEALRQPLESHKMTISRKGTSVTYPANFLLVAAFNPCPCGYYGDTKRKCECSRFDQLRYVSKLSGPILDRIDLQLSLKSVEYKDIESSTKELSSSDLIKQVRTATSIQRARGCYNGLLSPAQIEQYCILSPEAKVHLEKAFHALKLTMRSYHKLLRIARTLADMEQIEVIQSNHISEALTYRNLDKTITTMAQT